MSISTPVVPMSFETVVPLPGYTLLSKPQLRAIVDHNSAVWHAVPAEHQTEFTLSDLVTAGELQLYVIPDNTSGAPVFDLCHGALYATREAVGHVGYLGLLHDFDECENLYMMPMEYGYDLDIDLLHEWHLNGTSGVSY